MKAEVGDQYPCIMRQLFLLLLLVLALIAGCAGQPVQMSGKPLPVGPLDVPPSDAFDSPPELISGKAAVYPISKALNRSNGWATVEFTIDENGATKDLKVVDASEEIFGRHLMIAIRSWQFKPALKDGRPVPFIVRQHIEFSACRHCGRQ